MKRWVRQFRCDGDLRPKSGDARHHVSSVKRALHQAGYVVKKRVRPFEQLRPDVLEKRKAFLKRILRVPVDKLVCVDASGLNLAMGRAYAWVKRGQEHVFREPMNWGKNLTLLGAIRASSWVLLSTRFATTTKDRFVAWLVRKWLADLLRVARRARFRITPRHCRQGFAHAGYPVQLR